MVGMNAGALVELVMNADALVDLIALAPFFFGLIVFFLGVTAFFAATALFGVAAFFGVAAAPERLASILFGMTSETPSPQ